MQDAHILDQNNKAGLPGKFNCYQQPRLNNHQRTHFELCKREIFLLLLYSSNMVRQGIGLQSQFVLLFCLLGILVVALTITHIFSRRGRRGSEAHAFHDPLYALPSLPQGLPARLPVAVVAQKPSQARTKRSTASCSTGTCAHLAITSASSGVTRARIGWSGTS